MRQAGGGFMSRLGDLMLLALDGQATQEQLDEIQYLNNQDQQATSLVQSWVGSSPGMIEPPTGVTVASGNVVLGVDGIRIYNEAILTGWLRFDGIWYVGSDLSSANTTSQAIFSKDTTYNGENMGAGDVLTGSNSSGYANMLWDYSDKQLKFRGGTTVQAYVGTDGVIYGGAGVAKIDANGFTIEAGVSYNIARAFKYVHNTVLFGGVYALIDDDADVASMRYETNTWLDASLNNYNISGWVDVYSSGTGTARAGVHVLNSSTATVELRTGATIGAYKTLILSNDGYIKLNGGQGIDEFSIDTTCAGNSNTAVPTEAVLVAYTAAQIAAIPPSGGGGNLARSWMGI
jgi:hypothetical protein